MGPRVSVRRDRACLCTVGSDRERRQLDIHTLPIPGGHRLAPTWPWAWLRLSEDLGAFEKAASQPLAVTQTGPLVGRKPEPSEAPVGLTQLHAHFTASPL